MSTQAPPATRRSIVGIVVTVPTVRTTRRGTVMRFTLRDGDTSHDVIASGPDYWAVSQTRPGQAVRLTGREGPRRLGPRRFHAAESMPA